MLCDNSDLEKSLGEYILIIFNRGNLWHVVISWFRKEYTKYEENY